MPADVVARLDGVLAELATERAAGVGSYNSRPDASRPDISPAALTLAGRGAARKRRWPRTLAVAAAAAVVVAGGAAAVIGGFGTSSTSNDSSAGSAAESHAGSNPSPSRQKISGRPQAALPLRPSAGNKAPGADGGPRSPAAGPADGPFTRPDLHRATLRRDVERLVAGGPAALLRRAADQPGCRAPAVRAGEQRLAVRLDGRAASLVLGVTTGGRRTARVYSCTDPRKPVATTTVPVSMP
ncbi:MAG: hypothetical protein QOF53_1152 [Nocardioidaceae bacterium]|nr:hypothetical protein [Nocardioidaceae bacterium]